MTAAASSRGARFGDEAIQSRMHGSGLLRFRLRTPRFGGLQPAVAREASEGGSLAMTPNDGSSPRRRYCVFVAFSAASVIFLPFTVPL